MMARVNVEHRGFADPRLMHLGMLLGGDVAKALGHLVWLWQGSQQRLQVEATESEIRQWACGYGDPDLVQHFVAAGYLVPLEGGLFRISGNEEAIGKMKDVTALRKMAATERWAKERAKERKEPACKKSNVQNDDMQTDAHACTSMHMHTHAMQTDANGCKPMHTPCKLCLEAEAEAEAENTDTNVSVPRAPSVPDGAPLETPPAKRTPRKRVKEAQEGPKTEVLVPSDTQKLPNAPYRVFEAYRDSMLAHWSTSVQPTPFVLAQCKNLIARVGLESALQIAAYYPSRNSDWYVKKGHSPEFMVSDHSTLLREISIQVRLTPGVVKHITDQQSAEENARLNSLGAYVDPFAIEEEASAPREGARFLRETSKLEKLLEG